MFNLGKLLRGAASTAFALGFAAAATPAAHADVIYNNLGSSQDGSDPIFGVGPLAQSFKTGAAAEALGDIQLLLTNGSSAYTGNLQVSLLADSSTSPGATLVSLGTLADALVSTAAAAVYEFTPVSQIILAANTTYWVEIAESAPNAIEWSYSYDLSALGVANQSAYSVAYGVNPASSYGAYQMIVGVPEPMTLGLVASGLFGLGMIRRRRAA